jgi:predicted nucleic acid-binding protein
VDSAYVLDSYALIAHFEDEPVGGHVGKILKSAQAGKTKLYLSVINLGEIYYNTVRERGWETANKIMFLTEQLPIIVVAADREITLEAARLKAIHPVAYADFFAAALGITKKAAVVTGDPEFNKFSDLIKIAWI